MKIEQIDNPSWLKRGKYERYIKRQASKTRRREAKQYLKGNRRTMPNDKQYYGWTT